MGYYYGERKYKVLWIIGYIVLLAVSAILGFAFADAISAQNADPENGGWSIVGLVLVWAATAPALVIPLLLGLIGWFLTARNNGVGAKRYKLLTVLPILVAAGTYGAIYLL